MRRARWQRLFAVLGVIALVAAGCGDDDDAAPTDQDEPGDGVVTLTATDWEFAAPDEIHASTVQIEAINDGALAHEFAFVKLDGQSAEDFFAEFDVFVEADFEGPLPDAIFNGLVAPGGGELQPGEPPIEAEITMTEGDWLLFCALSDADTRTGDEGGGGGGEGDPAARAQEEEPPDDEEPQLPPHYQLGMFQEITVTGDSEPEPPPGSPRITTVDYGFEGLDDLEAGSHTAVGYNSPDSQQLHHIVAFDAGEGVSVEDAESQFLMFGEEEGDEGGGGGESGPQGRSQEEEPPDGEGGEDEGPPEAGFTFPMSPGYGTTFDLTLESGHTYVFACFISDREGGPPHAFANQMFQGVQIS